mgnify:FL=1
MLQAALEIVIERGYPALNIKAVAAKLGCSTAPISWQFKGMEGLRTELLRYAEQYAQEKYPVADENEALMFEKHGRRVVDMAFDEPNLFRFLYAGESGRPLSMGFQYIPSNNESGGHCRGLAELLKITEAQAADFVSAMVLYTQGVGTAIVFGIVKDTKENAYRLLRRTGITYLRGLGADEESIRRVWKTATDT